ILDKACHGLVSVTLVRAEDSCRTALDPPDGVNAGQRLAVGREHAAPVVRDDEAALVEGNPGKRHRQVADRPQDESTVDRLHIPVGGPGAERSVVSSDDLVAAYVHGLDPAIAADLAR